MFAKRGNRARAKCEHIHTISVRTAGIERVVCEKCGHVSFTMIDQLTGEVTRDQFERVVESNRSLAG